MIPTNAINGVSWHATGAFFAANCYTPQRYVKRWSWETFWMVQAAWCWLIWPIVGAACTIPQLLDVLREAPALPVIVCFLLGMAYGVGGTAFNISIRYIGFALTYAIAVGLSAILGTFIPPLVKGEFGKIFEKTGAEWVMAGVVLGALGIAVCGIAGRLKELDLQESSGGTGEFSMIKGFLLSLLAGGLSAVYGIATDTSFIIAPVVKLAAEHGAGYWEGNIAYLIVNPGAFLTALLFSLYLAGKNRSLGELKQLRPGSERASLPVNFLLAMLTGTLWYGQFFCYNLGHVQLGPLKVTSWAIHMIMLVLFSNLVAVTFREWKGVRLRTRAAITLGLAVLLTSVSFLGYGNYVADQAEKAPQTSVARSGDD
jgi:L-rhamnose-H+ transport protein